MSLDTKALEAMVKDSGVQYTQNSVSWIFTCPRCNKQKKLYLRKRDGRFVCWFCKSKEGYEGKPEYALRDLLNRSVRDIQEKLYGLSGVSEGPYIKLELKDFFGDDEDVPFDLLPDPPQVMFPEHFYEMSDPKAAKGLKYLNGRGIDLELAARFDLRYDPIERRVVFPILLKHKLVGWQARFVLPEKWTDAEGRTWAVPKILTGPKSFQRERVFMFQDFLETSNHAVLCEGPIDGVKCYLCGGVVVSMGKALSPGQVEVLQEWARRVRERTGKPAKLYLAIDPDAAAELTRLCRAFADIEVYHMVPPKPFEDFGDMEPSDVLRVFLAAHRVNAGRVFLPPFADFFTLCTTGERQQ